MIGMLGQLPVKRDAVRHPPKRFLNRSLKNFRIFSRVDSGFASWGVGVKVGDGICVTVGGGVIVGVWVAVGARVAVGRDSR